MGAAAEDGRPEALAILNEAHAIAREHGAHAVAGHIERARAAV